MKQRNKKGFLKRLFGGCSCSCDIQSGLEEIPADQTDDSAKSEAANNPKTQTSDDAGSKTSEPNSNCGCCGY